jgi:ferritin-like metal-binding protein YciE
MPELNSLHDLLIDELRDLYSAETQLISALPKMAEAANDNELKNGFTEHLQETKGHLARLEEALTALQASGDGKVCHAMKGLVQEGEEAMKVKAPGPIRDANLIGAAQRVEHYEIAAYGTARAIAETLGEDDVAELLQATLDEEAATDRKLTDLAEDINAEANDAGGESPEE